MKKLLVLLVGLLLWTSPALAEDLFPPVWRGETGTVFAEWSIAGLPSRSAAALRSKV